MDTIDRIIEKSARIHPTHSAIRYKSDGQWQNICYKELWVKTEQVAAGLHHSGVLPGDNIAIFAASSANWVISYLAILRAGARVVPIDKDLKSFELLHIFTDSDTKTVFTDTKGFESLEEVGKKLSSLELVIDISETAEIRPSFPIAIDKKISQLIETWSRIKKNEDLTTNEAESLEELVSETHQLLTNKLHSISSSPFTRRTEYQAKHSLPFPSRTQFTSIQELTHKALKALPHTSDDETAVILYTSGTTGRAKGAMLSHRNIVTNIASTIDHFKLNLPLTTLSFLPINHVFEQVCGILLPLSLGGTVVFAESLKKVGENLQEIRPTFFLGVPAIYNLLLDRIHRKVSNRTTSRILFNIPLTFPLIAKQIRKAFDERTLFISGGAPLDTATCDGFRKLGFKLLQGYGITETSPVIAAERIGETRTGTVGKPIKDVEVRIDAPSEDGIGEILVKGPNVMQGYYNNPEATREVLENGWYRTGDLGKIDSDGFLSIRGRIKNLIVTPNGKNVYPEEIEGELLKSPYICEAMVYGHKTKDAGEEVCAVIYPDYDAITNHWRKKPLHSPEGGDVEEIIRQEIMQTSKKLADYKRIKRFTLRETEFPKTATRKIKRFVVEAQIPTIKP